MNSSRLVSPTALSSRNHNSQNHSACLLPEISSCSTLYLLHISDVAFSALVLSLTCNNHSLDVCPLILLCGFVPDSSVLGSSQPLGLTWPHSYLLPVILTAEKSSAVSSFRSSFRQDRLHSPRYSIPFVRFTSYHIISPVWLTH